MLYSRQVRLLALRSQLCFLVRMSLVCENENNGDKFYRRNFMQVADEKLIILGPYICNRTWLHHVPRQECIRTGG